MMFYFFSIQNLIVTILISVSSLIFFFKRSPYWWVILLIYIGVLAITIYWSSTKRNPGGFGTAELGAMMVALAIIAALGVLLFIPGIFKTLAITDKIIQTEGAKAFFTLKNFDLHLMLFSALSVIVMIISMVVAPWMYDPFLKARSTFPIQKKQLKFKWVKLDGHKRFQSGALIKDTHLTINGKDTYIPAETVLTVDYHKDYKDIDEDTDAYLSGIRFMQDRSFEMAEGTVTFRGNTKLNISANNGYITFGNIVDEIHYEIANNVLALHYWVDFHENGMLKTGNLREDTPVQIAGKTIILSPGRVQFDSTGKTMSAMVESETQLTVKDDLLPLTKLDLDICDNTIVVNEAILERDSTITIKGNPVLFAQGEVKFYKDGSIKSGTIKDKCELTLFEKHQFMFKGGQKIYFRPDGNVDYYDNKQKTRIINYKLVNPPFDAVFVRKKYKGEKVDIDFSECKLNKDKTYLTEDCEIQIAGKTVTITVNATHFSRGNLQFASLAHDTTFQMGPNLITFKAYSSKDRWDSRLSFHDNWVIRSGKVEENITLQVGNSKYHFSKIVDENNNSTLFYDNGNVASAKLSEDTEVQVNGQQVIAKANDTENADIVFHANGVIKSIYLKHDTCFDLGSDNFAYYLSGDKVELQKDQKVYFDHKGRFQLIDDTYGHDPCDSFDLHKYLYIDKKHG